LKINLGSGKDYRNGFVNIEKNTLLKADIHLDLEKDRLPFKDSSVDFILIKHTLEHITNIVHLLNECHRILKKDGNIHIEVPNVAHPQGIISAFGDIFHVRCFSPFTFTMLGGSSDDYRFNNLKPWNLIKLSSNRDIIAILSPRK